MLPPRSEDMRQPHGRRPFHDSDVSECDNDGPDKVASQKRNGVQSNKRVSFGGANINVYYKDREYAHESTQMEPPLKTQKIASRSSPNPPPLPPRLHTRRSSQSSPYKFLPLDDLDESPALAHVTTTSDDLSSPLLSPSPEEEQSLASRPSINIFQEDDLIMGAGLRRMSSIGGSAADTTLELPDWCASKHGPSHSETVDEDDITQQILCQEKLNELEEPLVLGTEATDDGTNTRFSGKQEIGPPERLDEKQLKQSRNRQPSSPLNSTRLKNDSIESGELPLFESLFGRSDEKGNSPSSTGLPLKENENQGYEMVGRQSETVSLEPLSRVDKLDMEDEDEDMDMEDSCLNLSMTGDISLNPLKNQISKDIVERGADNSPRSSVGSGYVMAVDELLKDDDEVDGVGDFSNQDKPDTAPSHKTKVGNVQKSNVVTEKDKIPAPPLPNDFSDGEDTGKSPTQRILLDDVPDGEDATLHLHPILGGDFEVSLQDVGQRCEKEFVDSSRFEERDLANVASNADSHGEQRLGIQITQASGDNNEFSLGTTDGSPRRNSSHLHKTLEQYSENASKLAKMEIALDGAICKGHPDNPGKSDMNPQADSQGNGMSAGIKKSADFEQNRTENENPTQHVRNKSETQSTCLVSNARPPLPTTKHRAIIEEPPVGERKTETSRVPQELSPVSTPLARSGTKQDILSGRRNFTPSMSFEKTTKPKLAEDLSIEKFKHGLHICNIEFKEGARSVRRSSLMPSPMDDSGTKRFERSSPEGQVLDGVRKSVMVTLLQEQIARLRTAVDKQRETVREMDKKLASQKPKVFEKLCNINLEDSDSTKYSLHLKRLKKVCLLHARQSWAQDRMIWEKELADRLRNVSVRLKQDVKTLNEVCESIEQVCADDSGHKLVGFNDGDNEEQMLLRRRVIQAMSRMRSAKSILQSLDEEERDLKDSIIEMQEDQMDLEDHVERLTRHSVANSERKIHNLLIAENELNIIASNLSGITPVQMNPKLVTVRVGGFLEVAFSLHEEKVINVSCKALHYHIRGAQYERYVETVFNVAVGVSEVRETKLVCHIGQALQRMSPFVLKARAMLDDMGIFLRKKLGQVDDVGPADRDPYAVEVKATVVCFCRERRSKFDVSACGRTAVLDDGSISQTIEVTNIKRLCGTSPSNTDIMKAMSEGSGYITGLRSLSGGFQEIRKMLLKTQ